MSNPAFDISDLRPLREGGNLGRAIELAGRGYRVFPVNGKVPAISGGRGCLDATTDPEQLHQWWTNYPGAGIGLACGDGLVAFDGDTYKPDFPSDDWADLRALLKDAPTQRTRNGGEHLFARVPAGVNATSVNNALGQFIDRKSDGGYVVDYGVDLPPLEQLPEAPKSLCIARPSKAAKGTVTNGSSRHGTVLAALRGVGTAGDVRRVLEGDAARGIIRDRRVEGLSEIARMLPAIDGAADRPMPDLPDWTELEPIRWSWGVDRLYPAPGLTMIYGGYGCCKTSLAAHVCVALLRGDPTLLGFGVNEGRRPEMILWIACEDPPGFVRHHYLERAARGFDNPTRPTGIKVVYAGDRKTWGRKLGLADVPQLIERYQPGMIVLDYWNGLARMPDGQEWSIQSNFDVLQDLRDALWQTYQIPALLLHHHNAQGKRSGVTQIANSCDQIWELRETDSGLLELRFEKSRGDARHNIYLVREVDDDRIVFRPADREERKKAAIQKWEAPVIRYLLRQTTRTGAQADLVRAAKGDRRTLGDTFATAPYLEATGEKSPKQSPIWRLLRTPDWYEETP